MQDIRYSPLLQLHTSDFLSPGEDTAPRQLPGGDGASLHWLTHRVIGRHLVLIGWIERHRPGLAVAVVDDRWRLLATRFTPCEWPADPTGKLVRQHVPYAAHVCVAGEDAGGLRGTLVLEQACVRHYPVPLSSEPGGGGMVLTGAMSDWFDLSVSFTGEDGATIEIGHTPRHHEPLCASVSAVTVGERRHWFATRQHLPDAEHWLQSDPHASHVGRTWMVAHDVNGVPGAWRPIEGSDGALAVRTGSGVYRTIETQAFDATHAIALLHLDGRNRLCVVDPAGARIAQALPLRIAKGSWCVKSWRVATEAGGGSIWLATDNGKLSAAHRDSTLWRIDYGIAANTRTRGGALPLRATRLTDDRVVTASVALDYAQDTLVLWHHGHGIKQVDPMRGALYRHRMAGEWRVLDAAGLAATLPCKPSAVVEHFGRSMERPAAPALPEHGFTFAGRRIMVHASAPGTGFPVAWAFGWVAGGDE